MTRAGSNEVARGSCVTRASRLALAGVVVLPGLLPACATGGARPVVRTEARVAVTTTAPPGPRPPRTTHPTGHRPRVPARSAWGACRGTPGVELDESVCRAQAEGDPFAVIRLLEGRAQTQWQLEMLIESCRATGQTERALRHMRTFLQRYASTPRARQYEQILRRERPYD